ncbi:MAG TPA: peptidylprolyl isomerase [Gemmatimonadaceae bacterium]|jgi:peptidyl-prolyl cis-trans isomerase SurA
MRKISSLASVALALFVTAPAVARAQDSTQSVKLESIVAIVGDSVITRFELQEAMLSKIQQRAAPAPVTHADTLALQVETLNDMIDEELLLQRAKDLKIEVADADLTADVDRQIKQIRSNFSSETEFRSQLAKASLGTPEDYRKFLMEQFRRRFTHEKILRKLQQDGKIVNVSVTDQQIAAEFDRVKPFIGPKPAMVTWHQIVVAPTATAANKEVARVRAESLLVEIKAGGDFERIAKRESMDLQTKDTGGDLGWLRRGETWPEFERFLFGGSFFAALQPGVPSPVIQTAAGYHIIRIDRVQVGEAKAHQILIMPKMDSADIARAHGLADSVANLLKTGTPFDTLTKKFHDYAGREETSLLTPWVRDSLPLTYQNAFSGKKVNDISVFQIPGSGMRPDVPKFVVAQLLTISEAGEMTLAETRAAVRADLAQRGGVRRYVDALRKQTYVSVRLEGAEDPAKKERH